MARAWPWPHGSGKTTLPRLSARVRFYEAIAEARSSLAQFSGIPAAPAKRTWWSRLLLLALPVKATWEAGRQAWRERISAWGRRCRPAVVLHAPPRIDAISPPWGRLATHVGGLFLLLLLLLGGGFQGVLAYPVQTNAGGFTLAWQSLQPAATENLMAVYASIPAMPLVVKRPLPGRAEALPIETSLPSPLTQRSGVITYTVQSGDTLTSIAAQFGLRIETLYWYNSLKSADLLSVDQKLRVPETDGLIHEVKEGETLDSIAEAYGVRKGNLIAYAANGLREPYNLVVGQKLFVPGASKPIPRPVVAAAPRANFRFNAPSYASLPGGERFSWPAMGRITDRFGWTGSRWHTGLDIATSWGTPIYSAAAGTVTHAGWSGGLGYMVEIDHGDGWTTRYGHMAQQPEVQVGQWVERGQLIGYVGCTGWCTGAHVHFEIRYLGSYCDPLDYLQ